jgi:hypothetical protein
MPAMPFGVFDKLDPSGSRTELVEGGSVGEVAAVEEPDRG